MHFLYIDPGTGSLLLQTIAGGLLVFVLFFKKIWLSIFAFFKRDKQKENEEE